MPATHAPLAPAHVPTTGTPSADPARRPGSVVAYSTRLDREWQRLRRRPSTLARATSWELVAGPVDDLDDVLAAVGYRDRSGDVALRRRQDVLLGRLAVLARTDDLAARVVLQRLLPGLLAELVRRRVRRRGRDPLEELVSCTWLAIRLSRFEATAGAIAPRLVDDAWHRAFRAPLRRRSAGEVAIDPDAIGDRAVELELGALEELAAIVGEARRRGLDPDELGFVRDLLRVGSPSRLATERQVTPRTIRNHRDRAVHSLRRLAAA